jgi:hypothetical protein
MTSTTDPIAPQSWVAIDVAKGMNVAVIERRTASNSDFDSLIAERTTIASSIFFGNFPRRAASLSSRPLIITARSLSAW